LISAYRCASQAIGKAILHDAFAISLQAAVVYRMKMELSGSIAHNLRCAVDSAKRLRGKPIYPDTVEFWRSLISHAALDQQRRTDGSGWVISELIAKLEKEISESVVSPSR
jgi:hypothetical protein